MSGTDQGREGSMVSAGNGQTPLRPCAGRGEPVKRSTPPNRMRSSLDGAAPDGRKIGEHKASPRTGWRRHSISQPKAADRRKTAKGPCIKPVAEPSSPKAEKLSSGRPCVHPQPRPRSGHRVRPQGRDGPIEPPPFGPFRRDKRSRSAFDRGPQPRPRVRRSVRRPRWPAGNGSGPRQASGFKSARASAGWSHRTNRSRIAA